MSANYSILPTENFSLDTDPKLACTCGHHKCDKRVVNQLVLGAVQHIRNDYKAPIQVTSGGRCKYHPDEINKSKPGEHYNCLGIDLWYDGTQAMLLKIALLAGRYGATRVAAGVNFIHLGFTPLLTGRVPTWKYVDTLTLK